MKIHYNLRLLCAHARASYRLLARRQQAFKSPLVPRRSRSSCFGAMRSMGAVSSGELRKNTSAYMLRGTCHGNGRVHTRFKKRARFLRILPQVT